MLLARKMTIGSGRPTGPTVPPGRWAGLGGACPAPRSARLQLMLSLHQQFVGGGRPQPGGFSAYLQDARELPHGIWRFSDVADQRHAQSSGGPLPAFTARPDDRCARGRFAGSRGKAFAGAHARQSGHGAGIERPSAIGAFATLAGTARSSHLARLAGLGIRRDSAGSFCARRYGKIANQPWANRISAHFAGHGSRAFIANEAGK